MSMYAKTGAEKNGIDIPRRRIIKTIGALGAVPFGLSLGAFGEVHAAAPYPSKSLRMIHAFAAGSGTDVTGRLLSEGLGRVLHQTVVVENRPGASMVIGTTFAAKQPADGYTLAMVTLDSMGINPFLYPNIGYQASDFDPITLVGQIPLVLVGAPTLAFKDFEAVSRASSEGSKEFTLGTWGHGSVGHVVGVMISQQTPLKLQYVPYSGAAPSTQAVMGGHVDFAIITPQSAIEVVKSGRAKAYAVGGDKRLSELPDVPTFKELGFPDLRAMQWHGVAARAGGNAVIIDKLYSSCKDVFKDTDLASKILQVGYTKLDGRPPAEFSAFITAEAAAWGALVKSSIPPIS